MPYARNIHEIKKNAEEIIFVHYTFFLDDLYLLISKSFCKML